MTCEKEGCLKQTPRYPRDNECWKHGLCAKHYWGVLRYRKKEERNTKYIGKF